MVEEICGVKVYRRDDGAVLLIRGYYPCPHRTYGGDQAKHIHYYVTTADKNLRELIEWLEWGFWIDSGIETPEPIIERFFAKKCMGSVHFLGAP